MSDKLPLLTMNEIASLFQRKLKPSGTPKSTHTAKEATDDYWNAYLAPEAREAFRKEKQQIIDKTQEMYGEYFRDEDDNPVAIEVLINAGDWVVTNHGIVCLKRTYAIARWRIDEINWLDHMHTKTWINMYDFLCCFLYARAVYGDDTQE